MPVVRVLAAVVAVAAIAAIVWGITLVATVDREFQPRGSVGIALIVGGLAFLAVAALAGRPLRSGPS